MHTLRRSVTVPGVAALLSILFLLEWTSAVNMSQTMDEGAHLASGFTYIDRGEYRLNPEHPPLLKSLAALPLLVASASAPYGHPSWIAGDQWEFGRQFLYHGSYPAETLLLLGRLPMILLTILIGALVFLWSRQLFGPWGGLLSLVIVTFDPTILAHGNLVTTDSGFALFFLVSIYTIVRYLQKPVARRAVIAGVAMGLAQIAKFSAVLLWPILLMVVILALWHPALSLFRRLSWRIRMRHSALFLLTVLLVIYLGYGATLTVPASLPGVSWFYAARASITKSDIPLTFLRPLFPLTDPTTPFGAWLKNAAEHYRVPFADYVNGATKVFLHNYYGHESFAAGSFSNDGRWWYFPYAVLVKTPSGMLLLIPLMLLAFTAWMQKQKNTPLNHKRLFWFWRMPFSFVALALSVAIFFLLSMSGGINLGIRHVLVIYPALAIGMGSLVLLLRSKYAKLLIPISSLLVVWIPVTTLLAHPNYLPYFNEFAGGPRKGHKHLLDSNLDWGQGLIQLRSYLASHPPVEGRLFLSYFGSADLSSSVPPHEEIPRFLPASAAPASGTYVISASNLYNRSGEYAWLRSFLPDDLLGYSLSVYHFPSVNPVRAATPKERGL